MLYFPIKIKLLTITTMPAALVHCCLVLLYCLRGIMGRCRSMLVCCSTGRTECCLVNRFGYGVSENCHMGLYLPGFTQQRSVPKVNNILY